MMKLHTYTFLLVGVGSMFLIAESSGWLFDNHGGKQTRHCHGGRPYFIGTTSLLCVMRRRKRSASMHTLHPVHSWTMLDGVYFEWDRRSVATIGRQPLGSRMCKPNRDRKPSGFTRLSLHCLEKCARSYKFVFGKYHLLTNNCHHFTNTMSSILCYHTRCPRWCR